MNSSLPIERPRRSAWSWLYSASPAFAALALASLAVHGWILEDSVAISETSGPALFQIHLLMMGAIMLFATWLAVPGWLAIYVSPALRPPIPTMVRQIIVFIIGWLMVFGAMILIETSPASRAF